jgi:hypothetical protein
MKRYQAIISQTTCILLFALFLYSSLIKLVESQKFLWELTTSPLLSYLSISPGLIQYPLPITELSIAISLFFDNTRKVGLYFSFTLMVLFTFYLSVLFTQFANIPCACGGILGGMSYPVHIAFNIFFTLVAVVGIYTSADSTNEHSAPHTA